MDLKKKVEDIFDITIQPTVDIVSSIFLEGLVSSVVPGVTSAFLAYKQKRTERMIELFMVETKRRQNELEKKLNQLSEEQLKVFKDKYFGLVLDYVAENKQEEKIKYIVNGFINIATMDNIKEDVMLIYYDILDELNVLDIMVFRTYDYFNRDDGYYDILQKTGITHEQFKLIENKLERLGLIETKGQSQYEEMFENVKNIGEYLLNIQKGKKVNLKFKKPAVGSIKSYKLTQLGRNFINFFMEDNLSK